MTSSKTHFYLPDDGNSITEIDIKQGAFRLTANGKSYFDRTRKKLIVHIKEILFPTSYIAKDGRSDILRIGKEAMGLLEIRPGNRVKISRIDFSNYIIEKQ